MATKKREIYARMAVQLRTHDRAVRAESICPGAMGLYAWMLIQARGEETAGDVLEASALAAWGAHTSFRRKQVEALLAVELVERKGDRLAVVRYSEHNDGPEEIEANRSAARDRKSKSRHAPVTRDISVTAPSGHAEVPSSISCSSSLSESGSRSEEPTSTPRATPANDNDPPNWWAVACDTVSASVAPVDDRGARWLEYSAARERKGWATGQRDAVGWLSTVVRSERRNARAAPKSGGGPRGDRQGLPAHMPWLPTGTDPDPFGENS